MSTSLPFTSNAEIDRIEMWDRTVEIVGYVDSLLPRWKTTDSVNVRFYLNNLTGRRIQCIMWGEETIEKFEELVEENMILHIDGGFARPPKKLHYNKGNVPYEVQIYMGTEITTLGKYEKIENKEDIPIVQLADVIHWESKGDIMVKGFVKSNIIEHEVRTTRSITTFGCGAITDTVYKLEVRIAAFKGKIKLIKGSPIIIRGCIQSQGGRVYLQAADESAIDYVEDDGISLREVLLGSRELKRVAEDKLESESKRMEEDTIS